MIRFARPRSRPRLFPIEEEITNIKALRIILKSLSQDNFTTICDLFDGPEITSMEDLQLRISQLIILSKGEFISSNGKIYLPSYDHKEQYDLELYDFICTIMASKISDNSKAHLIAQKILEDNIDDKFRLICFLQQYSTCETTATLIEKVCKTHELYVIELNKEQQLFKEYNAHSEAIKTLQEYLKIHFFL